MIKEHLKYYFQLYAANCAAVYAPHDFYTSQRYTKKRKEELLSPYDTVIDEKNFTDTVWFEARRRNDDMFEIVRCEEVSPASGVLNQEPYIEEKYKPANSDVALFPKHSVQKVLQNLEDKYLKSDVWSVAERQPYRATFYNRPEVRL